MLQMFQCPTMPQSSFENKIHTSSHTYSNALRPLVLFFINFGTSCTPCSVCRFKCLTCVVDVVKRPWCWMDGVFLILIFIFELLTSTQKLELKKTPILTPKTSNPEQTNSCAHLWMVNKKSHLGHICVLIMGNYGEVMPVVYTQMLSDCAFSWC